MKSENMTKEQLINEITKLQQKVMELEHSPKNQNDHTMVSGLLLSNVWFSTGSNEIYIPENTEEQQSVVSTNKYKFSDLVDIPLLQELLNSFYKATGIPHAVLDTNYKFLSGIGWQDICTQFHRVFPETRFRCKESDCYIASHLHKGPYVGYKCLNGLMDYAAPIIVEGQHLATVFQGQLLHEPPDEDFFRGQAQKYGFDEEAYIQALRRVPIIPEDQIASIMKFYSNIAQVLASLGLERLRRIEETDYALKEKEERLLQSQDKFAKAFHCNPDLMAISTLKDGRYVQVNDAFVKLTGYERQETIGRTAQELGIWVVPAERDNLLKQIQEQGSIRGFELELRGKSGEIRTFNLSGEIINFEGEPHLICSIRDITERKRMEEDLRLSEECLSKAFEASPVSMTITALEDGRFIKANTAFCKIIGYSQEEAIGRTSLELNFWVYSSDRCMLKKRIMNKQPVRDMEIKFNRKTGEERVGLLSMEGLNIHGELCILSELTDITDLRQMEVEMTRLDRLNIVGEMAASIGHEIRNPMTTVRGYLQLLQLNKDYQQQTEYFDLMIEELDRANSIITEFLSLAKNKAVELKLTSLNLVIGKLLPLIQANAMSRDQQIKLERNELPDLLLDHKEIRQLILNLVNNGLESMASGGHVSIRTFKEDGKAVLAVEDQGHGIDHELLDKLGTPFFTTKEQGTGLGLAVCYRIANRHNAQIDVKTSSTGTTFYVRFPSSSAATSRI